MIKPLQCKNCKHFGEDGNYKGEGKCNNDGRYTREHRVCNLLDKKLNSVEFLAKELYEKMEMSGNGKVFDEILEKAKEIHKQEIIGTFNYAITHEKYRRVHNGNEYYDIKFN
jgi:hypothetical protein